MADEVTDYALKMRTCKEKLKELDVAIQQLGGTQTLPPQSTGNSEKNSLRNLIIRSLPTEGRGITPIELSKALTDNGRETKNTSVASTLSRLKEEGIAEKIDGFWFRQKKTASEEAVGDDG